MLNRSPSKPLVFVILLFTTLSVASWIFLKPQGPHGGVIKSADNYFIEMKGAEKTFSAFLYGKKLEPVDSQDIQGEVKFYFHDSADVTVPLSFSAPNEFTCVPPIGYYSCRIRFTVMGKSVAANFFNPMQVVLKK